MSALFLEIRSVIKMLIVIRSEPDNDGDDAETSHKTATAIQRPLSDDPMRGG